MHSKRKMSGPDGKIRICEWCGKHLVIFGMLRENGKKTHTDWETRDQHKQCWYIYAKKGHDPPIFWKRQYDPVNVY